MLLIVNVNEAETSQTLFQVMAGEISAMEVIDSLTKRYGKDREYLRLVYHLVPDYREA